MEERTERERKEESGEDRERERERERKKRGEDRERGRREGRERRDNSLSVCHSGQSNLPEPHNLLAVPGVVSVDGVFLPLPNVELLHAAQHQLQLSLVKEL